MATVLLRASRPQQWPKNLLVFAAPVAAGAMTTAATAVPAVGAFVVFCAASAGTYLLNDARDAAADRLHPTKRLRPVAAGDLSVGAAWTAGVVLVVGAVVAASAITMTLGATVAAYVAMTTAYSLGIKRLPVVELVVVAAGFVLRAVAGAAATDLPLSNWFFIVTSAGALMVVTAKRESELTATTADGAAGTTASTAPGTRAVLRSYTGTFLASVRNIAAGVVVVAYCLWAFGTAEAGGVTIAAQLSVVPFAVAILRYVQLADAGQAERPERTIVTDPTMLGAGALWAVIYGYGVYVA